MHADFSRSSVSLSAKSAFCCWGAERIQFRKSLSGAPNLGVCYELSRLCQPFGRSLRMKPSVRLRPRGLVVPVITSRCRTTTACVFGSTGRPLGFDCLDAAAPSLHPSGQQVPSVISGSRPGRHRLESALLPGTRCRGVLQSWSGQDSLAMLALKCA